MSSLPSTLTHPASAVAAVMSYRMIMECNNNNTTAANDDVICDTPLSVASSSSLSHIDLSHKKLTKITDCIEIFGDSLSTLLLNDNNITEIENISLLYNVRWPDHYLFV